MKPDSPLYYFRLSHLETIMATYPLDFPSEVRDEMRTRLKQIRLRSYVMGSLMFGILGFALVGSGRHWYKLTSNRPIRWGALLLSFC